MHYLTVISELDWPVAVVPAPPAVIVTTPALVIVPARFPATPPEVTTVFPKAGMSATTPADTSTPEPIAGIASPWSQLSSKLKLLPEVFISYTPTSSVAAAVADPAVIFPKCSQVVTFMLLPETA